jgi:hypothetical protein
MRARGARDAMRAWLTCAAFSCAVLAFSSHAFNAYAIAPLAAAQSAPKASAEPANTLPKPTVALQPGEYLWMPQLAPKGPVVIIVSLPEQLAYVYRNGVRIGISTVSTGKAGYETPTGVFTILEKSREHYSNLYDNAPMPFMQRLTWDGVALHAGKVPNYPASHGCVRLPYAFSEKLFGITSRGMTVVIADDRSHAATVAFPGLFAPVDAATGDARTTESAPKDAAYHWTPEAAPEGPITLVMSTHDSEVAVLRNGIEIGHAQVRIATGYAVRGTQAYVLLEGSGEGASQVVPDRPALRWMRLPMPAAPRANTSDSSTAPAVSGTTALDAIEATARGDIAVAPDFAQRVYDVLTPGTTLIVTDEPLHGRHDDTEDELTILRADRPPIETPSTSEPPHR